MDEYNKATLRKLVREFQDGGRLWDALGEACRWNLLDEIRTFLQAENVTADQRNENLQTASMLANTPEAMAILLDAGADINAVDANGNTPLISFLRCRYKKAEAKRFLRYVIAQGANTDAVAIDGTSAIDLAQDRYNICLNSLIDGKRK